MAAARGDAAELLSDEDKADEDIRVMRLMEIFPHLSWRQLRRHCDLFPANAEFEFLVDSLIDVATDGGTPPQEDGQDGAPAVGVLQNSPRGSPESVPGSPINLEWGTPPQELNLDVAVANSLLRQNLPRSARSSRKLPQRPRLYTRRRIVVATRRIPRNVVKESESEDSTEETAEQAAEEQPDDSVVELEIENESFPEMIEISDSSASPSPPRRAPAPAAEAPAPAAEAPAPAAEAPAPAAEAPAPAAEAPAPAAEAPAHLRLAELFPDVPLEALTALCDEHPDFGLEQLVAECLLIQEAKEAAELTDIADLSNLAALDLSGATYFSSDDEAADDHAVAGALAEENIPDEPEDLGMIERYQMLLMLFPSADPDFLRERAALLSAEEVPNFVARTLETGQYPKEEEYRARERVRLLKAKYIDRFDAAEFLATIPDPVRHFESRTAAASAERTTKVLAYLNLRYGGEAPEDLVQLLERHSGNLSLACVEAGAGQPIKDLPDDFTNDEALLQEMAFIEHREELILVRRRMAESKQVAVIAAQDKKETLTCGCCYVDTFLLEDMAACLDGHLFCKECIVRSAEVLIGEGKFKVPCLEDCGKEFSVKTLKAVLKRPVFLRLEQRRQFEEVHAAEIPDLETCPACDFSAIPRPDDIVFTCLNPDCQLVSCRKCGKPNHIPLHCDELPEEEEHVRIRTQLEDRMTQALVRECWQCKKKFVKLDGCNKMTCTCGAIMCYLCRQPVRDYSHFNGPGGDATEKCELFSTNEKLHVDAVREEALKARAEVAAANPNLELKYDPTLILP